MLKGLNAKKHDQKVVLNPNKSNEFFRFKSPTYLCCSSELQMLFTSISFVLISYSLLLISKKPVTGYEISIYSSTPLVFWISILLGLVNGILLLLSSISTGSHRQFCIGYFQVIYCNVLLVLLPKLRNYVLSMGRGDSADYVGYAKDVCIYGHILNYNFYPYTSVIISQISQILNIPVLEVSYYIPPLFTVIYMLSIYIWAKSFKNDQKFVIYSIIASVPLFFAWFSATIYYMLIATLILPLVFYVINKNSDFRFRILVVIFCFVLTFAHPIISLIFLLYLIGIFFEEQLLNKKSQQVSLRLIMIFFISCFIWFFSQYALIQNAISILGQIKSSLLMTSSGTTSLTIASGYVNKMGFFKAAHAVIIMSFDEIVYYIFSLFSIYFILKNSKKELLPASLCFLLGSLFYVVLFVSSYAHTPYRLTNLDANMIFTPLLLGYLMVFLRHRYVVVLNLIIILTVFTTVASLYQSPITFYPNDHFTAYDISGANWLLNSKNENIPPITLMTPLNRYSSLICGSNYTSNHGFSFTPKNKFPTSSNSFENGIFPVNTTQYFWITQYEIEAYNTVWKGIGQFNEKDFESIESCKNVYKIYNNKEFSTYFANATMEVLPTK